MTLTRTSRSWGSSPLTRGKQTIYTPDELAEGLIPAHAGKTDGDVMMCAIVGAHPRSRGENTPDTQGSATLAGSSPLTRGKRRRPHAHPKRRRLIPAHAGKTHA